MQTLRDEVLRLAAEQYGTEPEYLWKSLPEAAVLRHADNKKWYGLIMRVERDRLGLPGDGEVDILNVKADTELTGSLRLNAGVLPAYHMNKTQWLTLLLDGTVEMALIAELLDISYNLTGRRAKKRPAAKHRCTAWLVPANPKFYDIEGEIRASKDGTFLWKQSSNISMGDEVYLYLAAPVSAIRYRCRAMQVNIPYEYADANLSMSRVMRLEVLAEYDPEQFGMKTLNDYGVYAVRGPRSVPNPLLAALHGEE